MSVTESTGAAFINDPALAVWEVASVISSAVIAEWLIVSAAGFSKLIIAIPVTLAFGLMMFSHAVRNESLRDLGFRWDEFFRALKLLLIPTIIAALAFWLIGHRFGGTIDFLRWHGTRPLVLQLGIGFIWGLVQQYVLQGFINRRLMQAFGKGWITIVIVALIFSCLHLPNLPVVMITLLAGLIWAAIYQRAPNLYALAVSHSIMTWFVVSTLPNQMLHHLRVGVGFFG